mgnify:FL=1
MRIAIIALVLSFPAQTQRQPIDHTGHNKRQAVSFYLAAIREREQNTCDKVVAYISIDWLEKYVNKEPAPPLKKMGIRPESVNILKSKIAQRAIEDLENRIKQNKPVVEFVCGFGICSGDKRGLICGDGRVEMSSQKEMCEVLAHISKTSLGLCQYMRCLF